MTEQPDTEQFAVTGPALLKILQVRAEVRALLWFNRQFETLPDAVDDLWGWSETSGLVAAIGANAVQAELRAAFAPFRGDLVWGSDYDMEELHEAPELMPSEPRDYHVVDLDGVASPAQLQRLIDGNGKAAREKRGPPAATVDAFKFVLRQGNPDQLRAWLLNHPDDAPALLAMGDK